MNATLSLQTTWSIIHSLVGSLDSTNKRWLADQLYADAIATEKVGKAVAETEKTITALDFPRLPKDWQPSERVMSLPLQDVPKDFDFDAELEKVWEEMRQ
ncbi:MAG: hypothetical protein ACI4TV_05785 [Paludibacteraceae bacterium]